MSEAEEARAVLAALDQGNKDGAKLGSKRRRHYVMQIMQIMAAGEWERGVTAGAVALEWGYSEATIRNMAAEASRALDITIGDKQKLVEFAQTRLRVIAEEDGKDRVPALKTLLESLGELHTKVDVTVTDNRSPEQLFEAMLTEINADPLLRSRALEVLTRGPMPALVETTATAVEEEKP